jgi:hypothetical protein
LDFVEESVNIMKNFLQSNEYTCAAFLNIDFKEGELRQLGRDINNTLQDLHNEDKNIQT